MTYLHLSEHDRRYICDARKRGIKAIAIARHLGRSRSTICREVKRNRHYNGHHPYYTHSKAHEKAIARRSRSRRNDHITPDTWLMVTDRIKMDWSPEQISHRLAKDQLARISHETIYRRLKKDKKSGGMLYKHLRHQRKKRRKRYGSRDRRGRLSGKRMISTRPESINQRLEFGHWEMDTVMGKYSHHCLLTLVERKTGLTLIWKLTSRTAEETNRGISMLIKTHPHIPFLTITSDNGSEFHGYKDIENKHQLTIYFAQPYHSWERGSNENANGLIRQYLPKGKNLKWTTQDRCDHYAECLNTRPRKRLDWETPNMMMSRRL